MRTITMIAPAAALLLVAGARGALAQRDAVRLVLAEASRLDGRAYTLQMTQTAALESPDGRPEVGREVRARIHLAAAPANGTAQRLTMRVDSLRASITTPHNREIVDTRRHRGKTFAVTYTRTGGPPAFDATTPSVDFTSVGGELSLGTLLAHAFPPMPERPVRVGESWERAWTRTSIDGNTLGDRPVLSRLTLRALQGRGADRLARLEIVTRGAPANGASAVEAKGFALVDVASGVVRELSLDETVSGTYHFGAGLPYQQTTTLRLASPAPGNVP